MSLIHWAVSEMLEVPTWYSESGQYVVAPLLHPSNVYPFLVTADPTVKNSPVFSELWLGADEPSD